MERVNLPLQHNEITIASVNQNHSLLLLCMITKSLLTKIINNKMLPDIEIPFPLTHRHFQ